MERFLPFHLPDVSAFLQPYFENYGYSVVGIVIFLESIGMPLPAETLVVAVSLYAAGTHVLNIFLIALITVIATILGNIVGYFIGKKCGNPFLNRFGKYIGLNQDRLLIGRYLCCRFGRVTIIFSRFFAFLRLFASLIAGALEMQWRHFLIADIIGGILWGVVYSIGTFYFGEHVLKLPLFDIILVVSAVCVLFLGLLFLLKREEAHLLEKAREFFKEEKPPASLRPEEIPFKKKV